jgi:hypothetical protein
VQKIWVMLWVLASIYWQKGQAKLSLFLPAGIESASYKNLGIVCFALFSSAPFPELIYYLLVHWWDPSLLAQRKETSLWVWET